jgi:cytochrome c-type biogenesis protein CcsB
MNSLLIVIAAALYAFSSACFFFGREAGRERRAAWGSSLLVVGALLNAAYLVARGVQAGNLPVADFAESLPLLALLMAIAGLVLILRMRVVVIGLFVAPLATVALVAGAVMRNPRRIVLPESLRSGWLPVHVTLAFTGYALFVLATAVSLVYLTYEFRLKAKRPISLASERVPSLEKLDRINYHLLGWGFIMLSLAIVTGAIWADATWGHYWSWEPQEIWSLVTWILYAALLESRLTAGWRGRRAAALTIVVFTVLLGSFVGLGLLHIGKHTGSFD